MAIELPNSSSPTLSGHEITGQLRQVEFMSPADFSVLTNRFVASVKITEVSEYDRSHGYKANRIRTEDKTVIGEGGRLQTIPQFEMQLGSYLSSSERGIELVKLVNGLTTEAKKMAGESVRTTYTEDLQRTTAEEIESQLFYSDNKDLVDVYIETRLSEPVSFIPEAEL